MLQTRTYVTLLDVKRFNTNIRSVRYLLLRVSYVSTETPPCFVMSKSRCCLYHSATMILVIFVIETVSEIVKAVFVAT
jgi:hypothetical protein